MKIRFHKAHGPDLKELLADIPRRVKNTATEVGRAVSEQTAIEVQRRLGGRGGWIRIYSNSIIFLEGVEGGEWAIAGLNETRPDLFEYPAENSLLFFGAPNESDTGGLTSIMANENPWPIDVIPPLKGAYPTTATVQMHDPGTVETHREARLRSLSGVIELLQAAGGKVDENPEALVLIDRVYADIAYMARRLELGFHGYPRIPHWGPTLSKAASSGDQWASTPTVLRLVENAIKGKEPGKVATMSPTRAAELARIREASWS